MTNVLHLSSKVDGTSTSNEIFYAFDPQLRLKFSLWKISTVGLLSNPLDEKSGFAQDFALDRQGTCLLDASSKRTALDKGKSVLRLPLNNFYLIDQNFIS